MNDNKKNTNEIKYKSNHIPLPLKIVWILFIIWGIGYSIYYVFPDLKFWLNK
jgi:hypothetical protein